MTAPGEVGYAHSGGVDVAYMTVGEGDRDLLFVPGFVSHLDLMWDVPGFAGLLRGLARLGRVTVIDKRGTGLSSRGLGFGSIAERADDIRAVMDAVGIEKADILAISEGGPLALLYAATHPDRVSSLALYGTFAYLPWAPDHPAGIPADTAETLIGLLEDRWGSGEPLRVFIGNTPFSDEATRLLGRFERSACSPSQAAEILRNNMAMDVRGLLSTVMVPSLVMHNRHDPVVPFGQAVYLAEHLSNSRLVLMEGDVHMSWTARELDWLLDEVAALIGAPAAQGHAGSITAPQEQRTFATVMLSDICGSTELAARMGDREWRNALDLHDRIAGREVQRHTGRVVKSTGDGMLAVFRTPSDGVACARQLVNRLAEVDMPIRVGLHSGEIELRGSDISGLAVHIASRVNDLADSGEVLVSRTVKDLMAGSDTAFGARGPHRLKGFDEDWELYAAG